MIKTELLSLLAKHLCEHADVLILVLDRNNRITDWNPYAQRLFDRPLDGVDFSELAAGTILDVRACPLGDPSEAHLLNLKIRSGLSETFLLRFLPWAEHIVAVGNVDTLELGQLRYQISKLNSEMHVQSRELQKRNQSLCDLNRVLEQHATERAAMIRRQAEELRDLARDVTLAEQQERKRIAGLLHDDLQQLLVGARMELAGLRKNTSDESLLAHAQQLDKTLVSAVDATRSLVVELSPPVLQESGLPAALAWLGRKIQAEFQLRVDVRAEPLPADLPEDVAILLLQAVREILFNVVKHAGTTDAAVTLEYPSEQALRLVVSDQGVGAELADVLAAHSGTGMGLPAIRKRIQILGGRMEIDSAPGRGMRIEITIPLTQEEQDEERGPVPA